VGGQPELDGSQNGLAEQLGADPDKIHVVSPFMGGGLRFAWLADPAHRA
jgi:hypothetical protein